MTFSSLFLYSIFDSFATSFTTFMQAVFCFFLSLFPPYNLRFIGSWSENQKIFPNLDLFCNKWVNIIKYSFIESQLFLFSCNFFDEVRARVEYFYFIGYRVRYQFGDHTRAPFEPILSWIYSNFFIFPFIIIIIVVWEFVRRESARRLG